LGQLQRLFERIVKRLAPGRNDQADLTGRRAAHDVVEHWLLDVGDVEPPGGVQHGRQVQGLQAR
jgi:hypothetical protein